ncbi:hypothetical protein LTR66_010292 [Elasticomyces elasticus]|nr:hypothetical protein LTR66_010292 [Elasticomyces elasticus]
MDSHGPHDEGAQGSSMFADGQYNGYAHAFLNAPEQSYGPSWDLDAGNNPAVARSQSTLRPQGWPQHNDHSQHRSPVPVSATPEGFYGRSLSKSPAPFQNTAFSNHSDIRQIQQSPYDPALVPTPFHGINYSSPANGVVEVANSPHSGSGLSDGVYKIDLPAGTLTPEGRFLIISHDDLVRATQSHRMHNFINYGDPREFKVNKVSTLPLYTPRKSRNELKKMARDNPKLLARLGKKPSKRERKERKILTSTMQRPRADSTNARSLSILTTDVESASELDSSDDDDDDDSSYASSEGVSEEPSPLPAKRPDSPLEAVRYDAMKALWRTSRRQVTEDDIRTGLKEYWEVVRTIRDRWKADKDAVTQAEEKKRVGELPLLRSRVKDQRDMLLVALKTALQHGHKSIMQLSAENVAFLFLLYQFLSDRLKEDDHNGEMSRSILEILVLCTTLTEELLEKTHLDRILPRYKKKGDVKIQELLKMITDNAIAGSKKKKESEAAVKVEKPAPPKSKEAQAAPPTTKRSVESSSSLKRPAPATSNGQPSKRVASGLTAVTSPTPALAKAASNQTKRPVIGNGAATIATTSASAPPAVKTKPIAGKPTGFFSSLSSAPKKPGTALNPSKAPTAAGAPTGKKVATPSLSTKAASKPTFSFAETMANLTKPKEKEPTPKLEDNRPPETSEEKAKRLRKEQRRKLRVSFKPENSLVEIRLFTHDPEEELGHDASMTRDVADVGGEGRMFKQHKDMTDVDDEDDGVTEETFKDYSHLSLIDFRDDSIPPEERERLYAPYGGGSKQPDSAEKKRRAEYESVNLMAYYTHPSQIPPTPREPPDPYNGETVTTKAFGQLPSKYQSRSNHFMPVHAPPQQPSTAAVPDLSALLGVLNPQQLPSQSQPPQATQTANVADLEKIFASFKQPTTNAVPAAPVPQISEPSQQPSFDLSALLANMQQPQAPALPAGPQLLAPMTQQPTSTSPGLAAMFAQYTQGQAQTQQTAPQLSSHPGSAFPGMPGVPGMPRMQTMAPQYANGNTSAYPHENEDRKRYREQDDVGGAGGRRKQGKFLPGGSKRFTLPCRFFASGKCQKGSECTYLHE